MRRRLLKEQAKEKGINPETISSYIESFKYGAYPHGGFGVGVGKSGDVLLRSREILEGLQCSQETLRE